jgi:hypothetical protein
MRLSNRKTDFKPVKKPILIVCEDSKSSVLYLEAKIKDLYINPIDIKVDGNSESSPISVVDYALEKKLEHKKKVKKEGIEDYEAIYCVMDVDDHPSIKPAINKAQANELVPIVSNQCFELWYLLHFIEYSTAFLHREEIYKLLDKKLGKDYDKADKNIFELLNSKGSELKAIQTAKKLKASAIEDSTEINPLRNPSTDVFILIEKLNSIAK